MNQVADHDAPEIAEQPTGARFALGWLVNAHGELVANIGTLLNSVLRWSELTSFFYRTYFILSRTRLWTVLRRTALGERAFDHLKRLIGQRYLWVSVQSGLSQGMWMQLVLPRESRYWRGIHEPEVQDAISSAARLGYVVYDVGAHLGSISLGAAQLVGESGRVVAFEGDPENVERLRKNAWRNRMEKRLQVVHAAIWSSTARQEIGFRRGRIARSHGGVEIDEIRPVLGDGEITTVPTITLDGFVAAGGPLPHLIKIDVEGGEYEVLRGGAELFRNQRPLLIVEVHHQLAAEQIAAWIEDCKYAAQWKIPQEDYPRRLFAWPLEYDGAAWMRETTAIENQRGLPLS